QCFIERLAEYDPYIFHRVVLIHVEIAARLEFQIEAAMMREQFEHVVKEANTGGDPIASAPFDSERDLNLRFLTDAFNTSLSHTCGAPCGIPNSAIVLVSASSNRSVCSCGPSVMRTHPVQPWSLDRSRTRMPRRRMCSTKPAESFAVEPTRARTKFALL